MQVYTHIHFHGLFKLKVGMLRDTNLYAELMQAAVYDSRKYTVYGDPAYPMSELILKPYCNRIMTPEQVSFNKAMNSVRQAVEWGFGKVIIEFAFLDFKKNQKIFLQNVSQMYKISVILTNCHTCLYGSQTETYFNTIPPILEEYLNSWMYKVIKSNNYLVYII